jgi:predicted aspartyl protease
MRWWKAACAALAVLLPAAPAFAKCQLGQVAALPVRVTASRILLDAKINGEPVEVILDTGAQASMVFGETARDLKLPHTDALGSGSMYGVAGGFHAGKVRIRDFALGEVMVHDLVVWSGGYTHGEHVAMLLGRDVLKHWDVEYDVQHGAVRLLRPSDCHGDQVVYWTDSRAAVNGLPEGDALNLPVRLNGVPILATLDTGSPESAVGTLAARAARVAFGPDASAQARVVGLGQQALSAKRADFDQVAIGAEVVRHASLTVTDLFLQNRQETTGSLLGERADNGAEMLLGLDFVRAHRILVAPDQGMIYFTYAGGPVFAPPAPAQARPDVK